MLERIIVSCRRWNAAIFAAVFIFNVFPASAEPRSLKIISLLEEKKYAAAVRLIEKEIRRSRGKAKKGRYALLLSQIPTNIRTKKPRHEYAYLAARYAEDIPQKKRMQLWIEAGDGFFKNGRLKKAEHAYQKAYFFSEKEKASSETAYILYKRAWIQVNRKNHVKAFRFLTLAEKNPENRLRENMLFDIGRIWAESQYLQAALSIEDLSKIFQSAPPKEKKSILNGIIRGMRRKKKNIEKVFSSLAKNQIIYSQTVNHILTEKISIVPGSCGLALYMEKSKVSVLDKDKSLSVLNACSHALISKAKRDPSQKKAYFKKLIHLYSAFERRGLERWPLTLIYERLGWNDKACEESLLQIIETVSDLDQKFSLISNNNSKTKDKSALDFFGESFRLCEKAKNPDSRLTARAADVLLRSKPLMKRWTTVSGAWEGVLFQFLDEKKFFPAIKASILNLPRSRGKKDLLPRLFLSHIKEYQPEEIKSFLSRFSSKPARLEYIDILITAADFLTVKEMEAYLPLGQADSYHKITPWFHKALSGKLPDSTTNIIIQKLLKHFPLKKTDQKTAALFLALHYLKNSLVKEIFYHWEKLSPAFGKESLAVELFEKSLSDSTASCSALSDLLGQKSVKNSPLGKFMNQCCRLSALKKGVVSQTLRRRLKPPAVLRKSALAGDFVFLSRIQRRTVYLKKNISHLEGRTSKMIMRLRSSILNHQKRKWRSKALAEKTEALLQNQIGFFEKELGRLASSSPHGEKYMELKKIIAQWR